MAMPLSMVVRQVVESFSAKMGVTARAAPDHSYGFEFSQKGTLSILQPEDDERVIVALARAFNRSNPSTQRRLLNLAGFDSRLRAEMYAGMTSETYVIALAFEEINFDVQRLDEALFRLDELLNSI
jgi:hypothetical protein